MSKIDVFDELKVVMIDALLQMKSLVQADAAKQTDFMNMTKLFIVSVLSTAADLAETVTEGARPWLYAEIETAAKHGGLESIQATTTSKAHYSIADMSPNDDANATNYIGQQLSTTLFKSIHELPTPLRKPEMLLRGVEALLANLLSQKFENDAHGILDSLCSHVHMALNELQARSPLH